MPPLQVKNVLQQLSAEMSRALAGASCRRAIPRIDGSMYFDLERDGKSLRLEWLKPLEEKGALVLEGEGAKGPAARLIPAAGKTLARLCESEGFEILRWHNRDCKSISFDESVVDVLLAGRMQPGGTAWFGYVFDRVFQEAVDRIRITFSGPYGPVGFELRPALSVYDGPGCVLRTKVFYLVLVEDSRPEEKRRLLPHQLERFLGFLLSRAVHDDMRMEQVQPAQVGGGSEPISTSRWGNPRQWQQFFSDFEIERSNLCSFRFSDPAAWITHGEPECRFVEPDTRDGTVYWTCLPWKPLQWRPPAGESFQTNITEKESVFGGAEKLQEALSRAVRCSGIKFVCVNNTCLPKIIGDDVPSLIKQAARSSPVPIFDLNTSLDSPDSAFEDLVRQAVEAVGSKPADSRGVNLVGFPPTAGFEELKNSLAECGVNIASLLLPELGLETLKRYSRGRISFLYPHRTWTRISESTLKKIGVEIKTAPSPYGLRDCANLLKEIAAADGREDAAENWLQRNLPPLRDKWHELSEKARRFRIALVADEAEVERYFSPEKLHGFSLAPLLDEMGFGLDFLIRARQLESGQILDKLQRKDHRVFLFSDAEELDRLLGEGDFHLVFTEVFYDRRICRAGKTPLHLEWLEIGFAGAIRSFERVLHAAHWNFYRKYRNYLS